MTIRRSIRPIRFAAAAALALTTITSVQTQAQDVGTQQRLLAIHGALERMSGYGVFDFVRFSVDRGTVTLAGYAYNGALKAGATATVKQVPGVDDVVNDIEILPASMNDDRIRRATFYYIYTDAFLSRYASGGPGAARFEAIEFARFPGRQPFGRYPIHIVVKGGRTTLLGAVDTAADRQLAEVRARQVGGAFGVTNELVVAKP
jgi:hyperosmotically inducible protein